MGSVWTGIKTFFSDTWSGLKDGLLPAAIGGAVEGPIGAGLGIFGGLIDGMARGVHDAVDNSHHPAGPQHIAAAVGSLGQSAVDVGTGLAQQGAFGPHPQRVMNGVHQAVQSGQTLRGAMQAGGMSNGAAALMRGGTSSVVNKVSGAAGVNPNTAIAHGNAYARLALGKSGASTVNRQGVIRAVHSYGGSLANSTMAGIVSGGGGGPSAQSNAGAAPIRGGRAQAGPANGQVPLPAGGPSMGLAFNTGGAQSSYSSEYGS
jgi:hypothetical protein